MKSGAPTMKRERRVSPTGESEEDEKEGSLSVNSLQATLPEYARTRVSDEFARVRSRLDPVPALAGIFAAIAVLHENAAPGSRRERDARDFVRTVVRPDVEDEDPGIDWGRRIWDLYSDFFDPMDVPLGQRTDWDSIAQMVADTENPAILTPRYDTTYVRWTYSMQWTTFDESYRRGLPTVVYPTCHALGRVVWDAFYATLIGTQLTSTTEPSFLRVIDVLPLIHVMGVRNSTDDYRLNRPYDIIHDYVNRMATRMCTPANQAATLQAMGIQDTEAYPALQSLPYVEQLARLCMGDAKACNTLKTMHSLAPSVARELVDKTHRGDAWTSALLMSSVEKPRNASEALRRADAYVAWRTYVAEASVRITSMLNAIRVKDVDTGGTTMMGRSRFPGWDIVRELQEGIEGRYIPRLRAPYWVTMYTDLRELYNTYYVKTDALWPLTCQTHGCDNPMHQMCAVCRAAWCTEHPETHDHKRPEPQPGDMCSIPDCMEQGIGHCDECVQTLCTEHALEHAHKPRSF